jgi:type I restriction enzyme M protein
MIDPFGMWPNVVTTPTFRNRRARNFARIGALARPRARGDAAVVSHLANMDALIDEIHDTLRAKLGLESVAALVAILGALRADGQATGELAAITRPLAPLSRTDASLASKLAARILTADARRFSGLYPTPAAITALGADLLDLRVPSRVIDPACGAGAFLLPFASRGHEVHGVDRNPQMIELARYALGDGATLSVADALRPTDAWSHDDERFDAVVLNPPFGMHLDAETSRGFASGSAKARTPSEVLFVERAAELLRPGGKLAAIVPAGFFRNRGLAHARRVLEDRLRLVLAVELPPEAFMHAGARMTSVLLVAERRGAKTGYGREGEVLVDRARDAGHDKFGRPLVESDLARVRARGQAFLRGERGTPVTAGRELSEAFASSGAPHSGEARPVDSLCAAVRLGKTPPKEAYADAGHFIVKVGNLTGRGLDFSPRDRNFVTTGYARSIVASRVADELTLRPGDLLVTSSAHARRYIAEKMDLVAGFPEWIEGPVFYVGELLLFRPRDEATGLDLLGYFRSRTGRTALRALARGQTAHLLPRDVRALHVPAFPSTPATLELRERLKREALGALELERERRAMDALVSEVHGGDADE